MPPTAPLTPGRLAVGRGVLAGVVGLASLATAGTLAMVAAGTSALTSSPGQPLAGGAPSGHWGSGLVLLPGASARPHKHLDPTPAGATAPAPAKRSVTVPASRPVVTPVTGSSQPPVVRPPAPVPAPVPTGTRPDPGSLGGTGTDRPGKAHHVTRASHEETDAAKPPKPAKVKPAKAKGVHARAERHAQHKQHKHRHHHED